MVSLDLFWGASIDIQPLTTNKDGRKIRIIGDDGEELMEINVFTMDGRPSIVTTCKGLNYDVTV